MTAHEKGVLFYLYRESILSYGIQMVTRVVESLCIGDIHCAVANLHQSAGLARDRHDMRKDCQLFSYSHGLTSFLPNSYDSMLLLLANLTTYTTILLVNTSYRCPDVHELFRVGQHWGFTSSDL
ncbi:Zinc finger protein [Fusarium oxysporum f. sp. albedinis]|nr:Zinc finger protein [Fusarium oxysporum f. sp. albedinis]